MSALGACGAGPLGPRSLLAGIPGSLPLAHADASVTVPVRGACRPRTTATRTNDAAA